MPSRAEGTAIGDTDVKIRLGIWVRLAMNAALGARTSSSQKLSSRQQGARGASQAGP